MRNTKFNDVAPLHEQLRQHNLEYSPEQHEDGRKLHKWTNGDVSILTTANPFTEDGDAGNLVVEAESEDLLKQVFVPLAYGSGSAQHAERDVHGRAFL